MNIFIEQPRNSILDKQNIIDLCSTIIRSEGIGKETELQIDFVSEDEIRELNEHYRGKNLATDVISLPIFSSKEEIINDPSEFVLLGHVFVCEEYIAKVNEFDGINTYNHLNLAIAHGLLHLLGYTHDSDEEEQRMNNVQEKYLPCSGETAQ